jgi:acyl CoA:acetate/3-ketoacid CoA transferase beta subunit
MGGTMDIVAANRKMVACVQQLAPDGKPKIVQNCQFPLSGKGAVDMIITDMVCSISLK